MLYCSTSISSLSGCSFQIGWTNIARWVVQFWASLQWYFCPLTPSTNSISWWDWRIIGCSSPSILATSTASTGSGKMMALQLPLELQSGTVGKVLLKTLLMARLSFTSSSGIRDYLWKIFFVSFKRDFVQRKTLRRNQSYSIQLRNLPTWISTDMLTAWNA